MGLAGDRPACKCHDERMYWYRDSRYRLGGYWMCAVKKRRSVAEHYHAMDGVAYNHRLLQKRRQKALERRRAREAA